MESSGSADFDGLNKNKNKLALEQERACQAVDLKMEMIRLEHMDSEVLTLLQQMKQKAEEAEDLIQRNTIDLTCTTGYLGAKKPLKAGVQNFLWTTADYYSGENDKPRGYEEVRELLKEASVAFHLVEVQTSTRAKIEKLAEKHG